MVKLTCVGCAGKIALATDQLPAEVALSAAPALANDGLEVFFVCPLCSPYQVGDPQKVAKGILSLSVDADKLFKSILGRNFYDLALAVCQSCHEFHTMSVLDHGLLDLDIKPGRTYVITCPACYGKDQFFIEGRAVRVTLASGSPGLKVVETLKLKLAIQPKDEVIYPLTVSDKVEEDTILSPEQYQEYVVTSVLETMEDQEDGSEVTTRRRVADLLFVSVSTAARWLKMMVDQGLLEEDRAGRAIRYVRKKEKL